jgi:amino acid adenylation domain-containing protein
MPDQSDQSTISQSSPPGDSVSFKGEEENGSTENGCAPMGPRDARFRMTNPFRRFEVSERESSITARFSSIAAEYRDRVAVKTTDTVLTYGELDEISDRIAAVIIESRGFREEPVALFLSDDVWMVAAIFGTLKAGRFYVPLDPTQASARDQYILENCGAQVTISSGRHLAQARALSGPDGQVILVDEIDLALRRPLPSMTILPEALAFIIYTSGSTGEPKGVIQTHRNVLASAMKGTNVLRTNSDDRITLISGFTVGSAVSDIYGALLNGASLFPIRVNRDGIAALRDQVIEEGITIYHSVPSVFRYLASTLTEKMPAPALRVVQLGGEAVHRLDIDLYKDSFPDSARLYISYGASELNVIRQFFADKDSEIEGEVVPVGYAAQSTGVLIVDAAGDQVHHGLPGEVLVTADHLSPGYWAKPELTAGTFIPDPELPGCRAYRTGDLGRMADDGCLFHLGRKDFLIKVRGTGVDINELERNLLDIEGVSQAAVLVSTSPDGSNALTAFASRASGNGLTESYLRAEIKKRLPDFMAPAQFIICDELPHSVGAKIDRRALRELAAAAPVSQPSEPQTPENTVEERLCGLWKAVLGLDSLGIDDDFFNLGGHSLMAARLVADINGEFSTGFRPSLLLQASTIREMARAVVQPDLSEESSVVAINPTGASPAFFCVHGVGGEVLAFRLLSNYLGPNRPFFALRAMPTIGSDLQIEDIAERYVQEIERIDPSGPYRLGGYSFGGLIAFEMAQQLLARGKQVALLALIDAYAPGYPKPLSIPKRVLVNLREIRRKGAGNRWSFFKERIRVNMVSVRRSFPGFTYRSGDGGTPQTPGEELDNKLYIGRNIKRRYSPKPYPGRIDLFRATDIGPTFKNEGTHGWGPMVAAGGLVTHDVPGDHFSIVADPHVRVLADKLGKCLGEESEGLKA